MAESFGGATPNATTGPGPLPRGPGGAGSSPPAPARRARRRLRDRHRRPAVPAAGCTVLGVDADARMADVARGAASRSRWRPFEAWDPAGRTFDAVVAGQTWHWVDPVAGAAKAAEVLRPGGRLAVFWNVFQAAARGGGGLRRRLPPRSCPTTRPRWIRRGRAPLEGPYGSAVRRQGRRRDARVGAFEQNPRRAPGRGAGRAHGSGLPRTAVALGLRKPPPKLPWRTVFAVMVPLAFWPLTTTCSPA